MSTFPSNGPGASATPLFDQTAARIDLDEPVADRGRDDATPGSLQRSTSETAKHTAEGAVDEARGQAKQVGTAAADAGQRVASTTKDQASRVASSAVDQARGLYGQATDQLSEQAAKQQKNAATTLRTFGEDLSRMHDQQDGGGLAADLVHTLSQRAERVATWLEDREPGEVLDEVKQFAARRPGLFIAIAAVTGIVAARATKALAADAPHAGASSADGAR